MAVKFAPIFLWSPGWPALLISLAVVVFISLVVTWFQGNPQKSYQHPFEARWLRAFFATATIYFGLLFIFSIISFAEFKAYAEDEGIKLELVEFGVLFLFLYSVLMGVFLLFWIYYDSQLKERKECEPQKKLVIQAVRWHEGDKTKNPQREAEIRKEELRERAQEIAEAFDDLNHPFKQYKSRSALAGYASEHWQDDFDKNPETNFSPGDLDAMFKKFHGHEIALLRLLRKHQDVPEHRRIPRSAIDALEVEFQDVHAVEGFYETSDRHLKALEVELRSQNLPEEEIQATLGTRKEHYKTKIKKLIREAGLDEMEEAP